MSPRWGYLALAGLLAGAGLFLLLESKQEGGDPIPAFDAPVPASAPIAAPERMAASAPVALAAPASPAASAIDADLAAHVPPGPAPSMGEVISRLHQAGVHTGLGAFNPPGTRPPLIGLAVPEDFVLPPGFVRHHQATDDGQRIEPILMFAPDQAFVDAAGRPLVIPKDRVVPPELAPPGLPIRRIVVPPPLESRTPPP